MQTATLESTNTTKVNKLRNNNNISQQQVTLKNTAARIRKENEVFSIKVEENVIVPDSKLLTSLNCGGGTGLDVSRESSIGLTTAGRKSPAINPISTVLMRIFK